MAKRKPIWDILPEDEKKKCLDAIIAHFLDERGEKIGVIAAEQLLDVVMEKIIWTAYNKGIDDAKTLLQEKFADINIDLDLLAKG